MLQKLQVVELKEHCVCYVVFLAINKHLCVSYFCFFKLFYIMCLNKDIYRVQTYKWVFFPMRFKNSLN